MACGGIGEGDLVDLREFARELVLDGGGGEQIERGEGIGEDGGGRGPRGAVDGVLGSLGAVVGERGVGGIGETAGLEEEIAGAKLFALVFESSEEA